MKINKEPTYTTHRYKYFHFYNAYTSAYGRYYLTDSIGKLKYEKGFFFKWKSPFTKLAV